MAITFIFKIRNDEAWDEGKTYYYDGEENRVLEATNPTTIKKIFKDTHGYEMAEYDWDAKLTNAHKHLFAILKPQDSSLDDEMQSLRSQIDKYLESYNDPRYFKSMMSLQIFDRPGVDGTYLGDTLPGQMFKVESVQWNVCGYDWAKITYDKQVGWIAMSHIDGEEFGVKYTKERGEFVGVSLDTFLAYVKSLENQRVDEDGVYGAQCVDLITHVQRKFWNFWGQGNAKDFATNEMPENWTRGPVTSMGVEPGDILVWQWGETDPYGHIGIAIIRNQDGSVTSMEQNVDGTTEIGGPARYVSRHLDACIAVIRPKWEGESVILPSPPETTTVSDATNVREYGEVGTFTVGVDSINVRREPNSKTGEIVAKYTKGQSVRYDRVRIDVEGYVWISYIGGSGNRNWMATGETSGGIRKGPRWGRFY